MSSKKEGILNFSRNMALWVIIALLVFALFNLFQGSQPRNPQTSLAFSDFMISVQAGDVRNVTIRGNEISAHYRDGRNFQTYAPNDPSLVQTLTKQGVQILSLIHI